MGMHLVFFGQREDAKYLTPYIKIQPELEYALIEGVEKGLNLLAYKATVRTNSINIIERIPLKLRDKIVDSSSFVI